MLHYGSAVAWLPPAAIAVSITGAAVLLVVGRHVPRAVVDGVATAVAAGVTAMSGIVLVATVSGRTVAWSGGWQPVHGVEIGILVESDMVGAGLALLAAALTTVALLYSWRYFESVEAHFQALMLMFLAGMTGFASTGDVFDLFVFFELMSAASYALTGMVVEDAGVLQGSLNFALVNSLGAYFSLFGLGLLYARTGALGLAGNGHALGHSPPDALIVASFVLVLTGLLVKAAMVPFHFWLADAHAVAPPSVCVLFSGVMVPFGAYAAFRVYWVVYSGSIPPADVRRAFIVLGVLTCAVGAVMCVGQRHVKRMLAYSTIAHLGLFLCAFALLDREGTAGAVLDIAAHAGAKSALFLLAGVLLVRHGSVDEHDLYGRGDRRGVTRWLWVAGGLALASMPPFGDALAEGVGEQAARAAGYPWLIAVFLLVSGVTGGAVLRVVARVYFSVGPRPQQVRESEETRGDQQSGERLRRLPKTMLASIALLLGGDLAEGLVPGVHAFALRAAAFFVDPAGYRSAALRHSEHAPVVAAVGNWTVPAVLLGFAATAIAVLVAALGCWARPLAERLGSAARAGSAAMHALRRLHSGHVGDYVTWLVTGVAALAALVALPLMGR